MHNAGGKKFTWEMRVTYAACTIGDHVYHSRYLEFLEAARGEFSRSLNLSAKSLQEQDIIFPVIECRLKYLKPARYDDLLKITLWITQLTSIRLNFEYEITRDNELLVRGSTNHVSTTVHEKPQRMPENVTQALAQYLVPGGSSAAGVK
ncbi:MAG: acyl-CoA thioesterase [Verrucomicrobiota bacterium]